MKVALMVTCVNDAMFPDTGKAVVTLLRRLGVDVEFPAAQTCCAQPMVNTGYLDEAVPVVRTFVDAFAGYDAIVTPSGSCAGSARHQHAIVARRSGDAGAGGGGRARPSPKVYELTEFLVDVLGVTDVGAYFPHRVTYHPTCHSLRMLGVGDRPRRLLEQVRGLTLVDLPQAEECCGFGGTFAVKNADTSIAMGADKARHVRDTGAEVLVAGRQLLPDAHRRHCCRASGPAYARCTSPRSWRPPRTHADDVARHLRRDAGLPRGGPRGAGRHPAAAQPRPRHRAPSATSAPAWSPRSRTGRTCGSPVRRSRTRRCATSPPTWRRSRRG